MNLNINTNKKGPAISPMLYGLFFEDINYAGDGGLYAELIANRSFGYYDRKEEIDKSKMCWEVLGDINFTIQSENPRNEIQKQYAYIKGQKNEGLRNTGYGKEGFAIKKDGIFDFSCYAKADAPSNILVQITNGLGEIYASQELCVNQEQWAQYKVELYTEKEMKHAYLEIVFAEGGEIYLDYVSLFPRDTYNNRANGMRRDLVEALKDISPKFLRFPGGCIVEGRSFSNMYNWKETIGDVTERRINWNRWQMEEYQPGNHDSSDYFQTYGLGYYEYFLLCEDLGAKPVPVMNAGMTCQWHEGLLVPVNELESWINDVLDLIEFANGDSKSKWGKIRADMGHEEPFHLEYIGIGNEQWGQVYFERYEAFYMAISEKHPEIKLITSAGWTAEGKDFDVAVEWMKANKEKAYAVDEHFYKSPEWFLENIERYDTYDRSMPKVFAGEYAAHTKGEVLERKNNWYTALTEAAFLTGVEKNSDHVVMTCYAPLLAKVGHQQWQPNLIWFDNSSCYGTPSYYVQKLFSNIIGDELVETITEDKDIKVSGSVTKDGLRLIIKAVNISEVDKNIHIIIDRFVGKTTKHTICSDLSYENSCENPQNVIPVTTELEVFHKDQLIKGHSVVVYEIELL